MVSVCDNTCALSIVTDPISIPNPAEMSSRSLQVQLISTKIPDGGYTTAYRCGPLIDLCRGPHVPTTGAIKSFEVTKASGECQCLCACVAVVVVPHAAAVLECSRG